MSSNNINHTGKRPDRDWLPIDLNEQGNKYTRVEGANLLCDFAQTVGQCALSNIEETATPKNEGGSETELSVLLLDDTLLEDFDFSFLWADSALNIDPNDPLFSTDIDPFEGLALELPDLFPANSTEDISSLNPESMDLDTLFYHAENSFVDLDLYLKEIRRRDPFLFSSDKTGLEAIQEAKQIWEKDKAFWRFDFLE